MPATLNPPFTNTRLSNVDASRALRFFWPDTPTDQLIPCNLTLVDRCFAKSLMVMGLKKTVALLQGVEDFSAVSTSNVRDRIVVNHASAAIQDLLLEITRSGETWAPNGPDHFILNPHINELIRRRLASDFNYFFVRIGTGT